MMHQIDLFTFEKTEAVGPTSFMLAFSSVAAALFLSLGFMALWPMWLMLGIVPFVVLFTMCNTHVSEYLDNNQMYVLRSYQELPLEAKRDIGPLSAKDIKDWTPERTDEVRKALSALVAAEKEREKVLKNTDPLHKEMLRRIEERTKVIEQGTSTL